MTQLLPKTLAVATLAVLLSSPAEARPTVPSGFDGNVSALMRRMAPNSNIMTVASEPKTLEATFANAYQPTISVGPVSTFYDLDGPNDETWFYTMELVSETIEHEYYTEYILREFTFTVYDASMRLYGTVHDKMRYADDEVRVPGPVGGIDLLPVITKNYFNADDKYELVVSIAVNSTTPGTNHYYSRIYSIGGPTETTGVWDATTGTEVQKVVDKPVAEFNGFVGDVLDASTATKEQYYMTWMHEIYSDLPADYDYQEESEEYWQRMSTAHWSLPMYGPADANGKLQHVYTWEVPFIRQQGNMESTMPIISFKRDDNIYVLAPHYKNDFYEPFYSPTSDMYQAADNTFVIDLYSVKDNKATLEYTTEVPMALDEDMGALYTYYAVGSLRYSSDVDFEHFSTDGKPAYYVQRSNFQISSDGETEYSYYVYDVNGNKLKTIYEYAEGTHGLSDLAGQNPRHAFIWYDESYMYDMVDLIEGYNKNTNVTISASLQTDPDNDPEVMLANFDRVAVGNSYMYAFEMREPAVDENDNDIMRVAWMTADGKFDHMDEINMGSNVYYAQSYITSRVLNPELLFAGAEHEYMILIKRGLDTSSSLSQEELIIAQPMTEQNPDGRTLLHLVPCEKGAISNINVARINKQNKLMVIWNGDDGRTVDLYDLPLGAPAGIDQLPVMDSAAEAAIAIDGDWVVAPGLDIVVYDARGIAVAAGNGMVSAKGLAAGLYIAKAANTAIKFIVK